jgi:hypothetical protein
VLATKVTNPKKGLKTNVGLTQQRSHQHIKHIDTLTVINTTSTPTRQHSHQRVSTCQHNVINASTQSSTQSSAPEQVITDQPINTSRSRVHTWVDRIYRTRKVLMGH